MNTWIDTTKQPPPINTRVLVYGETEDGTFGATIALLNSAGEWLVNDWDDPYMAALPAPSHWMPLPDPPQENY